MAPSVKRTLALWLCTAALLGCAKPTREKIDRWRTAEHGEEPLQHLLADAQADPDLRARAAAALVARGETDVVVHGVPGRTAVVDALIPILAADATPPSALQVPTSGQIAAKDALFALRPIATPAQRDALDDRLAEWLGAFYEGRAPLGASSGEVILRAIGPRAAPRLLAAVRELVGKGDATHYVLIKDELLRGLALAGPDGISFLLDLVEKPDSADETLPVRAMQALAATTPDVAPALARLVAIAADPRQPGENGNLAFDLIASTGRAHCLPPLAELARSTDAVRVWSAVEHGLDCAGADGVAPMAEALPLDRDYPKDIIEKYFWAHVVALGPPALAPARAMLRSPSWIARLTGVEVLAKLGSAGDSDLVRALGGDAAPLRGWTARYGRPPSLGSEAIAVADRLEKRQERK
jgi:hypothetical protein